MTNIEQFEEFWQSHRLYPDWSTTVWKAWEERGKVDAKRITELEAVIVMQRETIQTLNSCIGGEGSLTTDNLVTIGRLETKLAIAIDALDMLSKLGNGDRVGNSIGNDIAVEALTKIKGE